MGSEINLVDFKKVNIVIGYTDIIVPIHIDTERLDMSLIHDPLPDADTTPVIEQYRNTTVMKLCTLLSAVISQKLHFRTLLTSLTPEDIAFINKNTLGRFDQIGINVEALDESEKIVLSEKDVKLQINKEDIQKNLYASMSEGSHKFVEDMVAEGKGGSFQNLVKHLRDHLASQQNVVNTTNKNAYEIRLEILKQAMSIVGDKGPSVILKVADELYKFVEGPKRR